MTYRFARKALIVGASVALAGCMLPTTAFASIGEVVTNSKGQEFVTYKLPSSPIEVQKKRTDANGNEYVQEGISVYSASPPANQPYFSLLGVNNVKLTRNYYGAGDNAEAQYALFGTDANENPDPYIYNYMVSINPDSTAEIPTDMLAAKDANNMTVEIDSTEYNMPREIYMEPTVFRSGTATSTYSKTELTYSEWIELENKRENRSKTGTWNPVFMGTVEQTLGSLYKITETLYAQAEAYDELIEDSKDANGNYTLSTRYAEGPNTSDVVETYEDLVKGIMYYVISKIDDGTVEKATVACISSYDEQTGNYCVRIMDTRKDTTDWNTGTTDVDNQKYAGRIAAGLLPIANDMTTLGLPVAQEAHVSETVDENDYVKWYTADQIVQNCDAVVVSDAPAGASYHATTSSGTYTAANDHMEGLIQAQASAKAQNKKAADLLYKWPTNVFGHYYTGGCENAVIGLMGGAFLYPSLYNLTDIMAYWSKYVWHITDASLQDIVDSTCYGISLSTNQSQIGQISADYDKTITDMITQGNLYYLKNYDRIDQESLGIIKTHSLKELKARTYDAAQAAAEKEAAEKDAEKDALQGQVDQLTSDNAKDKEKIAELEKNVTDAQAAAAQEAAQAAADKATNDAAVAALKAQIASLQASTVKNAKGATKTYKANKKGKLAKTKSFDLAAPGATFSKVSGNAKVTVSASGKVTVKKGLKKGTYKAVVKVACGASSKNVTVKVKIKK